MKRMRQVSRAPALSRRRLLNWMASAGMMSMPLSLRASPMTGVSDWSTSDHARVRLIDAGPATPAAPDDGQWLAGIEIQLDPMYLTYWRSPGEAGVAPVARFDNSVNLAETSLLFPAPRRFEEDGSEAIGYKEGVVFPLLVSSSDHAKPVTLSLSLSFAVCERQCLPVLANVSLLLGDSGQTPEAALVREAKAHVPAERAVGQSGALTILSVRPSTEKDTLTVLAKTQGNDVPLLFAEAPDPWFVQAGVGLWMNDGAIKYPIKVLAKPVDPAPLTLRLTLVGVEDAIEVPVSLDAPMHKP